MSDDSKKSEIESIREAVENQHRQTFANQDTVLRYIKDVEESLRDLVEKVIHDQRDSSKLFTDTRVAIESHIKNDVAEPPSAELRQHIAWFEEEREHLAQSMNQYKEHLENAKNQLSMLGHSANQASTDKESIWKLESQLEKEIAEHELAREEISKLSAQLQTRVAAEYELTGLRVRIASVEEALEESEARAREMNVEKDGLTKKLNDAHRELKESKILEAEHESKSRKMEREVKLLRNAKQASPGNTGTAGDVSSESLQAEIDELRPLRSEIRQLKELAKAQEIKIEYLKMDNERIKTESAAVNARLKIAQELEVVTAERDKAQKLVQELQGEVQSLEREVQVVRTVKDAGPREEVNFDDVSARQQLGDLLVASGVITKDQLEEVITEHGLQNARKKIGTLIVRKGFASEDAIAQAVAHQLGVPYIRVKFNTVRPDAVHRISGRLAQQHHCIPVSIDEDANELELAMANPMDLIAIENVEHATEFRVVPKLATLTDVNNAIRLHYHGTGAKI